MIPNLMMTWDKLLLNIGASFSVSPVKVRPTPSTLECIEKLLNGERTTERNSELSYFSKNIIFSPCFLADFSSARFSSNWTADLEEGVINTINRLAQKKWIGFRYRRFRILKQWLVLSGGGWEIIYCRAGNRLMLARFTLLQESKDVEGAYIRTELT